MSYQHGDPIWMELSTPDPAAAQQFYGAVFGWAFSEPDPATGYVFASVEGHQVAGLVDSGQEDAQWRVYLQVDDIAAAVSHVVHAGGRILAAPFKEGSWGTQAIIASPAGAVFALWQPEEFKGFALGHSHGLPAWFELVSSNFRTSLAFFADLVGWEYHFVDDDGIMATSPTPGARFAANGPSGHATAGVVDGTYEEVGEHVSHFRTYVAVADVERARAVVNENGGAGDAEERANPMGRAVDIVDPHGAALTLLEPRRG